MAKVSLLIKANRTMHFLNKKVVSHAVPEERPTKPWACVSVKLVGKNRLSVVPGSVGIIKTDTTWALLPENVIVEDDEEKIEGSFAISTETVDPYHVLIDLTDGRSQEVLPRLHFDAKSKKKPKIAR